MVYLPTGRELIDPFKVLEEAGIRGDMTVADFGCGTLGHYVFPAAQLVGIHGKVYAIDILKSVLEGVVSRKKMENANNVETIWGDLERPNGVALPDNSVDIGLLINNLFLSKTKEELVKECVRIVKSGGILVVIDWKPAGYSFGPPPQSRVTAVEARQLVSSFGLYLLREFEPGKYHYGFIFRKP